MHNNEMLVSINTKVFSLLSVPFRTRFFSENNNFFTTEYARHTDKIFELDNEAHVLLSYTRHLIQAKWKIWDQLLDSRFGGFFSTLNTECTWLLRAMIYPISHDKYAFDEYRVKIAALTILTLT